MDQHTHTPAAPAEKLSPLQVLRSFAARGPAGRMFSAIQAKSHLPESHSRHIGDRYGVLNVYAGTVPAAVKAKRRAHNKAARAARRINRR